MARKTFTQSMVVLAFLGFVACEGPPSNKARTAIEAESKQPASSCNLETLLKPGVPGSPSNLIESDINPNGDSELAHLMRKMLKDLQDIRPLVLAEKPVQTPTKNHERIHCSWPSDPGIRGPLFGSLSDTYLSALEHFKAQSAPNMDSYNRVVVACLGCHSNFCPGPIHLIQNLWIESPDSIVK